MEVLKWHEEEEEHWKTVTKRVDKRAADGSECIEHGRHSEFVQVNDCRIHGGLEAELYEELGYEPYDHKTKYTANSWNIHSKKALKTSMRNVEVDIPRDRNGKFEPDLLKKNQTSITADMENKIISMYAKGCQPRVLGITSRTYMGLRSLIRQSAELRIKCFRHQKNGSRDLLKAYMQ